MELLLKALTARGYAATLKDRRIKVSPGGLSNSVSILYDISLDRYVVKSHDLVGGITTALMLFNGLWTYKASEPFFGSLFIAMAMFGFLLIVMTELKIKSLGEYMDVFNLQHQAQQSGAEHQLSRK
ncbi:hypothetical protein JK628_01090 [Shewanella sp. KX20019]|uniref:hypothetical protein n=1 Tax=Shewanella sp. KX20019 TaxID=2803864 RepID=UPI001926115F|nr:hypothetical protein [Shewanella sp. KX20019]QQX80507.1 hypothetical protein JK628_01090 [Shewanella sp. KX20019]